MKKIVLGFIFIAASSLAFAQSSFDKAMTEKIAKLEATENVNEFATIASDFDKMGLQKDSWLPYYYAAYAYVKKGRALMKENKVAELDEVAAIAEKYALVAQAKNPKSAEVPILLKMIHGLRMMVNPQERFLSESALGKQALDQAEKLDPKNPRISLLKAEDLYFTPEQFGGNKAQGIKMYQSAIEQFKSYKPATSLDPNWGKEEAVYFVSQAKK